MSFPERLDLLLGAIAPRLAARRLAARVRMRVHRDALQRDISASTGGRLAGRANAKLTGPKANTAKDLVKSRAQARDLRRTNPYASGTINTIVANLVGKGIFPQARVRRPKLRDFDVDFNARAETAWDQWAERCDPARKRSWYSQQRLIMREKLVAGECLVVLSTVDDGRPIPFATEIVPSERLAMKDEAKTKGGGKIVQGVEFDAAQRIVGYWIYPNHPYEGTYASSDAKLVPADRVIHFFEEEESGQVRGLTKFMTVAGAFEGFMQWLDWLLAKERVASAYALAFVEQGGLLQTPVSSGDADDEEDDDGNPIDLHEGGMTLHLRPGEDVKGISSGVNAGAVDQLAQVFLRVIARGLDVAYETVSRDLSNVTYLSARQGENQDRRHWEPQQEDLNSDVNSIVWGQVIRAAWLDGALGMRGEFDPRYLAHEWIRPGWDWIDPSKDLTGAISAIRAGLRSPLAEIVARGGDAESVLDDIAQFKAMADERGLDWLTCLQPEKPAAAPAPAEGNDNGEAKDDSAQGAGKDAAA